MLAAVLLSLASLAVADLRVFGERGSKDCQDCLAEVEGECRGPTSSDQFNDCFCGMGEKGLAWPKLTECLTGSNAKCTKDDEYNILLMDWAPHCFAYKKNEEEEVCVDSTQDDKLLLSVADSFCTEFLTLTTGAVSATATATESSSAETTTKDGDDVTTETTSATETSAPITTEAITTEATTTEATTTEATTTEPTSTASVPGSDSDVGAGSGGNSNDDNSEESSAAGGGDEDDGVASLSATSLSALAVLALSVTGFALQLF